MTDNEIVKALECCFIEREHTNCPLKQFGSNVTECRREMAKNALDLINRQKEEIERLGTATEEAVACYNRMESLYHIKCVELKVAKAEAIKAFAERLCEGRVSNDPVVIAAKCFLKEMTEGKTNE